MKNVVLGILSLMIIVGFSGCGGSIGTGLNNFVKAMKEQQQQEVLSQTEDREMVSTFIKKMPKASSFATQIRNKFKLDLGKQTTNTDNWVYRPVQFFERNADKTTLAYQIWHDVVKKRGGQIKMYNANVSKQIAKYIYLNKLQSYERYYHSLVPIYIEYDHNGNMVSSFNKILKTEDLSSVGGIVVQGRRPYNAYQLDVILLKTHMRKFQLNINNRFLADNLLNENVI